MVGVFSKLAASDPAEDAGHVSFGDAADTNARSFGGTDRPGRIGRDWLGEDAFTMWISRDTLPTAILSPAPIAQLDRASDF